MGTPKFLHDQAMALYSEALIAQQGGDMGSYLNLCQQALDFERDAALMLKDRYDAEPTRSVLFRSAASLALKCGQHALARQLATQGLSGNPPQHIRAELQEVLDQSGFKYHWELSGLKLSQNEFRLFLNGRGVYLGFVRSDLITARTDCLQAIYMNIYERKQGRPYKRREEIDEAELLKSALYEGGQIEGADYGIVFRVAEPSSQNAAYETESSEVYLDEMLQCFEMLEKNDHQALREFIQDANYYTHFVHKAREIAPDGEDLSLVGFATIKKGVEQHVSFRRLKSEIRLYPHTLGPPLDEGETSVEKEEAYTGTFQRASGGKKYLYFKPKTGFSDKKLKV